MAVARFGTVWRRFLQRVSAPAGSDPSDADLIARFAAGRDEAAFAELVRRYGPLVLGVCRRVLRDCHDAEDVFQATFLVLARKAATVDGHRPLAGWLYTVARNLALKHQGATNRHRDIEKEAIAMRAAQSDGVSCRNEVAPLLDAELGRLPDKYRLPLVLCYLQGMTHEAAARALGWPAGSMAKRLERGLEVLRERLAGRGAALSTAALAAWIGENASAAVSPALIAPLSQAAALYAAGQATTGLVSAQVTTLAAGAVRAFALTGWRAAAALGLGLVLLGAGAAALGHRSEQPEAANAPAQPANSPEPPARDPRDIEVMKKLEHKVNLDKGIDPNTPLKDVFDFLSDRYELPIRIDQEAFTAAGVDAVEKRGVVLPKMVGVSLEALLRRLLRQIEPRDGRFTGYRIEKGTLVITPQLLENRPIDQFPCPPGLPERLLRPVRCEEGPFNMSLAEALDRYGKLYGQKLVLDRKAFAAVGEPDAAKYPLAGRSRDWDEPREVCLEEILRVILWQVGEPGWSSYTRVREDAIEITAAKNGSERGLALVRHMKTIEVYLGNWDWKRYRDQKLQAKLHQKVYLEKGIDANTPLEDVLTGLSDRYEITFLTDTTGFAGAGIDKVLECPIGLPPQVRIPLAEALDRILVQVGNERYTAGFAIREDFIEIVPVYRPLRVGKPLESRHLDELWANLANPERSRARVAARTLAQAPEETLAYLSKRLKPAVLVQAAAETRPRVKKWLVDLNSNQFALRQKAAEELVKCGASAVPFLRQRLGEKPSLEVRQRIEQILRQIGWILDPEQVRALHAVRVLDEIGNAEARRLLGKIAAGEPTSLPTQAAVAALARVKDLEKQAEELEKKAYRLSFPGGSTDE